MPKFIPYAVALLGLVFALAGCALFYGQVVRGRKQAEAEILSGEVESFEQTDEGTIVKLYRSKYEVRFDAEGREIRSPVRSTLGTSEPEPAQARLRGNPVGSRRPIYYLPARPEDFVIEPLERRIGFSLLFFSIGVTVMAVAGLLLYETQPLEW